MTRDAPRCMVRGTVRSVDGCPLPGAVLDVWQADDAGFYDTRQPDRVPEGNLRGLFTTNTARFLVDGVDKSPVTRMMPRSEGAGEVRNPPATLQRAAVVD